MVARSRVVTIAEELQRVRGRLELHRERFEPEWRVPSVEVLDERKSRENDEW